MLKESKGISEAVCCTVSVSQKLFRLLLFGKATFDFKFNFPLFINLKTCT